MTLATLIKLVGPTLAHALIAILFKGGLKEALDASDFAGTLAANIDIGGLVGKISDGKVPTYKSEYVFRRIGDETTEKLMAIFEQEGIEMGEGEQEEAVAAAVATIDRRALPLLLKRNLSGYAFRQELRREKSATPLSEAQTAIYERILDRSASLVYAVADELPHFTRDSTAQLLENENQLLDQMEVALETQQKILDQTYAGQQANQSQIFEQEYRKTLANELDNLELFGVEQFDGARQPLMVAYIKLQAAMDHDTLGVEEALGQSNRLLVVGPAGSGKTTLLKWVTVQASRYKLDGPLADWAGRVPFYLRLRDYANRELPPLEQLYMALPKLNFLTDIKPDQWTVTQFREQKGLLIIDGMDEVSEEKRQAALAWLDQVLTLYDQTIAIVSSRPSGLGSQAVNQTLTQMRFRGFDLQPLEEGQIEDFVRQWHQAMEHPDCKYADKSIVPDKAADLLRVFEGRQDLRRLAQTPLLCSMICALHLLELGELPQDRIRLYNRCINILLQRDERREIQGDSSLSLRPETIHHLLAGIAFWMLENDPALIKRSDAQRLLENQYGEDAPHLLNTLAARSVLFRQQAEDEFDFIHRTFLEFIAGQEIVRNHQVKRVIQCYGLDSEWHEAIRLLAAHTRNEDQVRLLDEIFALIQMEPKQKRALHLLAWDYWSLLDQPTLLANQALTRHIDSLNLCGITGLDLISTEVNNLLPLSKLTQLQYLDLGHTQISDIMSLSKLINLQELGLWQTQVSDLAPLAHLTSLRELSLHDSQVSDLRPLANLTRLENLQLWRTPVRDLSPLANLTQLKALHLSDTQVDSLYPLTKLTHLQYINLDSTQVSDLSALSNCIHLQYINLENTQVEDISPLFSLLSSNDLNLQINEGVFGRLFKQLRQIDNLNLGIMGHNFCDSSPLSDLVNLRSLDLWNYLTHDLSPLSNLIHLQKLNLVNTQVLDLSPLSNLIQLQRLRLNNDHTSDLSPLSKLIHLEVLYSRSKQVSNLSALSSLQSLQELHLNLDQVNDLSPLAELPRLQHLHLNMQSGDLLPLSGWISLHELNLNVNIHVDLSLSDVKDLSPLSMLPQLQQLGLVSAQVSDLSPLAELTRLQRLDLSKTLVSDLSPLANLTQLQSLNLRGTEASDLSPLADLIHLQELILINTAVTDLSPVKHIEGLRIIS